MMWSGWVLLMVEAAAVASEPRPEANSVMSRILDSWQSLRKQIFVQFSVLSTLFEYFKGSSVRMSTQLENRKAQCHEIYEFQFIYCYCYCQYLLMPRYSRTKKRCSG